MGCFFVYTRIFYHHKSALSLYQSLSSRIRTHTNAARALARLDVDRIPLSILYILQCVVAAIYIFFLFVVLFFSRVFFHPFNALSLSLSHSLGRRARESFTYQSAPGFRQSSRTPSPKSLLSPKFARKTSRRASETRPRPLACARCLP